MFIFNENLELVQHNQLLNSDLITDNIWLDYLLNLNNSNYIAAFYIIYEFVIGNNDISYQYFTCFVDNKGNIFEQNIFIDINLSLNKITDTNFTYAVEKSNHLKSDEIEKIMKTSKLSLF